MERVPKILTPLLYDYGDSIFSLLGSKIYGIYLYNSIALEDFDGVKSDIDFVTVLNHKLDDNDIKKIESIHHSLINNFDYAHKMEGMYLLKKDLNKSSGEMEKYPYFANGNLIKGYYDFNNVTRWVLKNYGVEIMSPSKETLEIHVEWKDIIETMEYNLFNYWESKIVSNEIQDKSDEFIEWAVLTISRIINTLNEKKIDSKCASGQYILRKYPGKWDKLVTEALLIRKDKLEESLFEDEEKRSRELVRFIRYAQSFIKR
ncbi:DUF4111 domain-containing protein [Wukongibacter baidiensis]|uniref:aminoglycoside adenylyltransferase domain-containing protein n=1 Tax=Wukongibacter baidiensis TaxID=1723361 RepID=UPI003D7F931E